MREPAGLDSGWLHSLQVRSGLAELPERVRNWMALRGGQIGAPAQAAPARGGAGIVHRGFVGAGRAGRFAQPVNAAHVAGGGQHGMFGRQQAGGFAFIGLGHQGDAAIGRQAVNAAVLVGGEENLLFQRQQVVDVLLLGTPQGLDGVVRVDAVDRGFFDAADIHHRGELGAHLGCGGEPRRRAGLAVAWSGRVV